MKALHGRVAFQIPEGWRVCGENLYAVHSLAYTDLPSYFMVFSVWDGDNRCLSWDDTVEWAELLGLHTVPVLYDGPFDLAWFEALDVDTNAHEGYVVRLVDAFAFDDFGTSVAKWVRAGHVQTDEHWMHQEVVPNGLRPEDES